MEPSDLLRRVVTILDELGVEYFVTGSVATIFYGEPRFTNDIDIVLRLPPNRVADLCRAFPSPEYYLSEEAARAAAAEHGQFNVVHPASGLKVDLIVADNSPFNVCRFRRVKRIRPTGDFEVSFASPEDVIIKKLAYYAEGGSDKHLRDIAGMLKISGDRVDPDYITEWASRLGLTSIWHEVRSRAPGNSP